jgi:hypothetical protein
MILDQLAKSGRCSKVFDVVGPIAIQPVRRSRDPARANALGKARCQGFLQSPQLVIGEPAIAGNPTGPVFASLPPRQNSVSSGSAAPPSPATACKSRATGTAQPLSRHHKCRSAWAYALREPVGPSSARRGLATKTLCASLLPQGHMLDGKLAIGSPIPFPRAVGPPGDHLSAPRRRPARARNRGLGRRPVSGELTRVWGRSGAATAR